MTMVLRMALGCYPSTLFSLNVLSLCGHIPSLSFFLSFFLSLLLFPSCWWEIAVLSDKKKFAYPAFESTGPWVRYRAIKLTPSAISAEIRSLLPE